MFLKILCAISYFSQEQGGAVAVEPDRTALLASRMLAAVA